MTWIPFMWSSDTLFGRRMERLAIFLRGKVLPIGKEGAFQFDLGAPRSVIYGNAFDPDVLDGHTTGKTAILNGREVPVLDLSISVGDVAIEEPLLLRDFGEGEIEGLPIIGTVGADLVDGRILICDFPNRRLAVLDSLPEGLVSGLHFTEMKRAPDGHMLLRAKVGGRETYVMYDSGSSIFGLLTTREIWETLTNGEITDSFRITAWGKVYTVYGGRMKGRILLGGEPLPVEVVHYVSMPGFGDFLKRNGAVGIVGNRPFWNGTIVLDNVRGRFGLSVR